MKKIKITTDENKRIVGYAVIGDLPNCIEIEVEDDFIFKGYIRDYTYKNKKINYEPDLESSRKKKREELKEKRKEKIEENIEIKGDLFQVRKEDLDNFYNLKIAMDLDSKMKTQKVKWILADNTIKEFNYIELMNVLSAYMLRKQNLFLKFGELTYKLEMCRTIEEIEKIKWE